MPITMTLAQLGWRPFFQKQIDLDRWDHPVARVVAQHRNRLELLSETGSLGLDLLAGMPSITVGDWLLLTPDHQFDCPVGAAGPFSSQSGREQGG
jgi:ribosome biogenesis GTPase